MSISSTSASTGKTGAPLVRALSSSAYVTEVCRLVMVAFDDLKTNREYVCKADKGTCSACTFGKLEKKMARRNHEDRDGILACFVFYSKEDAARLAQTGELCVWYGAGGCDEAIPMVAVNLVKALRGAGLQATWNAEEDDCVRVRYAG